MVYKTRLAVILVAISTISMLSADCYIDSDGYKQCYVGRALIPGALPVLEKKTTPDAQRNQQEESLRGRIERERRETINRTRPYPAPQHNPYDGTFYSDPTYAIGNGTNRNMGNR